MREGAMIYVIAGLMAQAALIGFMLYHMAIAREEQE